MLTDLLGPTEVYSVDGRPKFTSLAITSQPAASGTYRSGETIEVTGTFNQEVEVEGQVGGEPTNWLGGTWRRAWYARGSGTDTLVFAYPVKPNDRDGNGFSTDCGGIDANGNTYGFTGQGTIRDEGTGVERNTWYHGQRDVGHPVDGTPYVTGVSIASTPAADNTHAAEETIWFNVGFDQPVEVEGEPRLNISVAPPATWERREWRPTSLVRAPKCCSSPTWFWCVI